MLTEFIAVGIGGFIGSSLRFGFSKIFNTLCAAFPFGTLVSNVIAGIAIGFIIGLEQQSVYFSSNTKLFLTTGLLGGLSTFSTFSLETIKMLSNAKYLLAIGNILMNLGLSLLGVMLGMFAAKSLLKKT